MAADLDEDHEETPKYVNTYALDVMGEVIHITQAQSGKNGYFCRGCRREMQAVHSDIEQRKWFFRHDSVAMKGQPKCTYSDETHRHKIAKDILQRIKKIKVPPIYKFPPKSQDHLGVMFLKEAEFIEADSVFKERTFYEDENGKLCWGSNIEVEEKYLLIKPDVSFFDKDGQPILLIEIVVTHKVNHEKLAKVKHLGINTIEVTIPNDSEEAIEKSFYTSTRAKWIFNNHEQNTEYVSVSNGNSERLSSIDEVQRKLLEESFSCRASQVSNLIRSIERCLGSKQFLEFDEGIRREIRRVKENTERETEQLYELQERIQDEIYNEYTGERTRTESEEINFANEEGQWEEYYSDLEARYLKKRELLERDIQSCEIIQGAEDSEIEDRRRSVAEETGRVESSIDRERKGIESEAEAIATSIEFENESTEREEGRIAEEIRIEQDIFERTSNEITNSIRAIESEERELPERFRKSLENYKSRIDTDKAKEESEISRIEAEQRGLHEIFERDRAKFIEEYDRRRREFLESTKIANVRGSADFARKYKKLLDGRALLEDFCKVQQLNRRYRKAWETYQSGSYKE